jgi:hypothetical protein
MRGSSAISYDTSDDIKEARLIIGDTTFDLDSGSVAVSGSQRDVKVSKPELKSDEEWTGNFEVSVDRQDKKNFDWSGVRTFEENKNARTIRLQLEHDKTYQVGLTLTDDLGSNLQITWPAGAASATSSTVLPST